MVEASGIGRLREPPVVYQGFPPALSCLVGPAVINKTHPDVSHLLVSAYMLCPSELLLEQVNCQHAVMPGAYMGCVCWGSGFTWLHIRNGRREVVTFYGTIPMGAYLAGLQGCQDRELRKHEQPCQAGTCLFAIRY